MDGSQSYLLPYVMVPSFRSSSGIGLVLRQLAASTARGPTAQSTDSEAYSISRVPEKLFQIHKFEQRDGDASDNLRQRTFREDRRACEAGGIACLHVLLPHLR